jgi:DNA/RNA endonuclease YhcR with UshA esterase domain
MNCRFRLIAAAFLLASAAPLAAHHSWTADYDGGKPVTVKGVVTKVEWTNPHTHFYIEAKDEKGTVTMWNFEMASTLALERSGWSRKTLQAGDQVTITGFGGRAVTERAIAQTITTADGRSLFAGKLGQ